MSNFVKNLVLTLSLAILSAAPLSAHEVRSGNLIIDHPVIPAPLKAQPVVAGYLAIENTGEKTELLVSVDAEFADRSQLHSVELVEGVMRMRPLKGGLAIPAGETVVLKQGGFHLMFGKLSQVPEVGQFRKVTLNFARAGAVVVEMLVVDPADLGDEYKGAGDHSGHGDHSEHSDHSNHSDHSGHSH